MRKKRKNSNVERNENNNNNNNYKAKKQKNQQQNNNNAETMNEIYFKSMAKIVRDLDKNGCSLYGQYSNESLTEIKSNFLVAFQIPLFEHFPYYFKIMLYRCCLNLLKQFSCCKNT